MSAVFKFIFFSFQLYIIKEIAFTSSILSFSLFYSYYFYLFFLFFFYYCYFFFIFYYFFIITFFNFFFISLISIISFVFYACSFEGLGRTDSTSVEKKWKALRNQEKYYKKKLNIDLKMFREKLDLKNNSWNGAVTGYLYDK